MDLVISEKFDQNGIFLFKLSQCALHPLESFGKLSRKVAELVAGNLKPNVKALQLGNNPYHHAMVR